MKKTGCVVHVTTISHIAHMSGLWGRGGKKNLVAQLNLTKTHFKFPKKHVGKCVIV